MSQTDQVLPGCDVLPPMQEPRLALPMPAGPGAESAPQAAVPAQRRAIRRTTRHAGRTTRRNLGQRFASINAFLDFSAGRLNRAAVLTWCLLWRDTKPDGIARTSQVDLARRAGTHVKTIRRAVRELERYGLLQVARRGSLHAGPSSYRLIALPYPMSGGIPDQREGDISCPS